MFSITVRVATSFLAIALVTGSVAAREWSRFRGPNGAGVGQVKNVPLTWTERDYRWQQKLPGVGHSSPVLWDERLFLTSGDEATGERCVTAVDAATGKSLWTKKFAAKTHGKHKLNSLASATPALDERHMYVTWGTPDEVVVLALDHDGREIWRRDLGPFPAGHGFGMSPIVHDGSVILPLEHGTNSSLVALAADSGAIRWRTTRESKLHYATPCVFRDAGRAELIFTNWEQGIAGIDPATGRTNWQADVFDKGHIESSIGSPVLAGDLIVGVAGWLGYGKQAVAVRLTGESRTPETAWKIDRAAPLCTTPLVLGDLVFLWADEGIVTCVDWRTGAVAWRERVGGTFYASPVGLRRGEADAPDADDWVCNVSADGEVVFLAASRTYRLLARSPLGEPSHSTPAVAGGRLFLRTLSQVFVLGGP